MNQFLKLSLAVAAVLLCALSVNAVCDGTSYTKGDVACWKGFSTCCSAKNFTDVTSCTDDTCLNSLVDCESQNLDANCYEILANGTRSFCQETPECTTVDSSVFHGKLDDNTKLQDIKVFLGNLGNWFNLDPLKGKVLAAIGVTNGANSIGVPMPAPASGAFEMSAASALGGIIVGSIMVLFA